MCRVYRKREVPSGTDVEQYADAPLPSGRGHRPIPLMGSSMVVDS